MKANFEITRPDVEALMRALTARHAVGRRLALAGALISLAVTLVMGVLASPYWLWLAIVPASSVATTAYSTFFQRRTEREAVEDFAWEATNQSIQVDENQLVVVQGPCTQRISWTTVGRFELLRAADHLFLVDFAADRHYIIPRRGFATPQAAAEFESLMATRTWPAGQTAGPVPAPRCADSATIPTP
jgi:hypothetical protein